jgi:hypothetical protein
MWKPNPPRIWPPSAADAMADQPVPPPPLRPSARVSPERVALPVDRIRSGY